MKAIDIKSSRPFQIRNDKSLGVQCYGENNNFPQLVSKIVGASCTGKSCLKVYNDFVCGRGFADQSTQTLVVNDDGQTLGEVLRAASGDLTKFNGFALHVNYNLDHQIIELRHVPFEHIRFEKMDPDSGTFSRVAEHDDWGREFEQVKKFRKDDICFYNLFDPSPDAIDAQATAAGGWQNYLGQVLYFSGNGPLTYPVPSYEPELTDMRTEEGLSNVIGRNATNNMLSAGALIDINNENQSEEEAELMKDQLRNFQGDDAASNILYLQVRSKDEAPVFVPFTGENYDKAFSVTQKIIPDNIGRVFNQPPILRAQDVGANFGANLMVNAYNYYNSKTSAERQSLEDTLAKVMAFWVGGKDLDLSIQPLAYEAGDSLLARIGSEAVAKMQDLLKDPAVNDNLRRSILVLCYGLTEDESATLVPATAPPVIESDSMAVQLGVGGTQSLTAIMESATLTTPQKRGILTVVFGIKEDDLNELFAT